MAFLGLSQIPIVASGLAMLLLAGVLLAMDFHKRVNRAFACILILRGVLHCIVPLGLGAQGELAFARVGPILLLAHIPAILFFASNFPRRRGPLGRPGGGWWAIGLGAALALVYLLWPELYGTLATKGDAAVPAILSADFTVQWLAFGPLSILGFAVWPLLSALALLFAYDYVRSPPGTSRTSYFLVAAGFLFNGLFDGTTRIAYVATADGAAIASTPWAWVLFIPALAVLPAVAALALIARHHFSGPRQDEKVRETRLYLFAALAVASAAIPWPTDDEFFSPPALVLLALWRLALPVLVTFALLRYSLFDIDVKMRAAVGWAVVAGTFGAGWFVGSNVLQDVFGDVTGTGIVGALVAGAIMAAATPLFVRFGRWTAAQLMPGVHDFDKKTREASALYRDQFEMLQEDGILTPKERRSLDKLRERLELPNPIAQRIEAEILAKSRGSPAGRHVAGA